MFSCDCELENAYRMIEAAKSCGADAVKFQWCSSASELANRRGEPQYLEAYKYVEYDPKWLYMMKAKCDQVGIEYMVTAFLPADVSVIAPLVKRFKVAAKEAKASERDFFNEILSYDKPSIISRQVVGYDGGKFWRDDRFSNIWCVSKYPCPIDEISLICVKWYTGNDETPFPISGLSDHTGHVLTGAVAVGAGARVIEAHVRLWNTPLDNPDYPHSHSLAEACCSECGSELRSFGVYVQNIRTAERMCG